MLILAVPEEMNEALIRIAFEYKQAKYDNFTVLYHPLEFDWVSFPIEPLSNVDCFHPSLEAHKRLAKYVWNGLLEGTGGKQKMEWEEDGGTMRCLQETDRVGMDGN
ncbi:hypothetical protein BT69DRAFT_440153 [Atractiella rhizophila]|nr:hypothetical protein BT69DRAFT_440153 [Atractiella rhizophila]